MTNLVNPFMRNPKPYLIQRVRSSNLASGTTVTATLPATAQPANSLLVAIVKANDSTLFQTPSGWTLADSDNQGTSTSWKIYLKDAASETNLVYTWSGTISNGQIELQEWGGLLAAASAYGATTQKHKSASTESAWDPTSFTPDATRAAIIACINTSSNNGGVTADWSVTTANSTAVDGTAGTGSAGISTGYKAVNDGSAWDPANVTWTTARVPAHVIFNLKGA